MGGPKKRTHLGKGYFAQNGVESNKRGGLNLSPRKKNKMARTLASKMLWIHLFPDYGPQPDIKKETKRLSKPISSQRQHNLVINFRHNIYIMTRADKAPHCYNPFFKNSAFLYTKPFFRIISIPSPRKGLSVKNPTKMVYIQNDLPLQNTTRTCLIWWAFADSNVNDKGVPKGLLSQQNHPMFLFAI